MRVVLASVKIVHAPADSANATNFDYLPLILIAVLAGLLFFLIRR
jgi:hypothetical protein